ncbi:YkgJ family cysteine cluster protein [Anaerovibrio lipolyticus]|uniref:YkgJ family cysteine cluster protein n=1 Tax=Anaerovibrio lipolyticus TaxID=82374 RepID=UPI0011781C88
MFIFRCDKCGLCCQSLSANEIYKSLDRGDGVCKYYDAQQKLCSIYDERPIICNVDMYYEANLKGKIDRDTYYNTNYVVCEKLKSTIINK